MGPQSLTKSPQWNSRLDANPRGFLGLSTHGKNHPSWRTQRMNMEMHDSNPQVDALREKISLVRKCVLILLDHVQVIHILHWKDNQLSLISMGCFGTDNGFVCKAHFLNTWFLSHFLYSWVVSFESPSGFLVSTCTSSVYHLWIGGLWRWYSRAPYTWCNWISTFH